MKKIFIVAATLLCLAGTAVAQQHTEFRWHGIYLVGDITYGVNINRQVDEISGLSEELSAFMPTLVAGYQFRKETAIGVGASYVADPKGAYTQLPIFIELRSHYLRSQWSPYTALQAGYTFPLGSSSAPDPETTPPTPSRKIAEGGLYFGLEVGARYAFNRSMAIAAHLNYRLLQANKMDWSDAYGIAIPADPVALHVIGGGVSFYFGN